MTTSDDAMVTWRKLQQPTGRDRDCLNCKWWNNIHAPYETNGCGLFKFRSCYNDREYWKWDEKTAKTKK